MWTLCNLHKYEFEVIAAIQSYKQAKNLVPRD